ncbi:ABC transporter ATP-binding protein [Paraperlucidibaca sp.]|jgi:branched-chain amino acid transport system ATP-binding protein|uniref:ABC transporter ATP-binding protein n=1 Tax=Paraperlucidibaca sp. TaxID=2708021 RepID=UPI0030F3FFAD
MSLLSVRDLTVHYGGIEAVRGISLDVQAGELVSLIGANGAGKTSTMGALGGLLKAGGSLTYDGVDLSRLPAHERVGRGLALVPEGRGIFAKLTVLENLQMGAYCRNDSSQIAHDLAQQLEQFPRLAERRGQLAGTLSGGEQQMLAIARALMSRPKLLLLDEPSMGLAPILVEQIFRLIERIASEGVAVLLVEQNARQALEIAQRAYVMESGVITLSGEAKALAADPRVRAAYLGH